MIVPMDCELNNQTVLLKPVKRLWEIVSGVVLCLTLSASLCRCQELDARSYVDHGIAAHERGDFEHAVQCASEAIKRNPNSYAAYHNRAVAYIELGDYERATSDLTRAI